MAYGVHETNRVLACRCCRPKSNIVQCTVGKKLLAGSADVLSDFRFRVQHASINNKLKSKTLSLQKLKPGHKPETLIFHEYMHACMLTCKHTCTLHYVCTVLWQIIQYM